MAASLPLKFSNPVSRFAIDAFQRAIAGPRVILRQPVLPRLQPAQGRRHCESPSVPFAFFISVFVMIFGQRRCFCCSSAARPSCLATRRAPFALRLASRCLAPSSILFGRGSCVPRGVSAPSHPVGLLTLQIYGAVLLVFDILAVTVICRRGARAVCFWTFNPQKFRFQDPSTSCCSCSAAGPPLCAWLCQQTASNYCFKQTASNYCSEHLHSCPSFRATTVQADSAMQCIHSQHMIVIGLIACPDMLIWLSAGRPAAADLRAPAVGQGGLPDLLHLAQHRPLLREQVRGLIVLFPFPALFMTEFNQISSCGHLPSRSLADAPGRSLESCLFHRLFSRRSALSVNPLHPSHPLTLIDVEAPTHLQCTVDSDVSCWCTRGNVRSPSTFNCAITKPHRLCRFFWPLLVLTELLVLLILVTPGFIRHAFRRPSALPITDNGQYIAGGGAGGGAGGPAPYAPAYQGPAIQPTYK